MEAENNGLDELKRKNQLIADESRKNCSIIHPGLPVRITLETNNGCNLKCIMCQIKRPIVQKNMDFRIIESLSHEIFSKLTEIHPTTIGEPLLYPHFNDFIDLAKKYKVKLDLTTNGTLLNREIIQRILPILKDIKISIDAVDEDILKSIRKGINPSKLKENIKLLVNLREEYIKRRINESNRFNNRPTITLQMTLMKKNIESLVSLIEYASSEGLDRVKAYHLFAFSERLNEESLFNEPKKYQLMHDIALNKAQDLDIDLQIAEPCYNNNNNNDDNDNPLIFQNSLYKIDSQPCPLLWHELWVDINGDVLPCANPKRMVMGNIMNTTLSEIWNGKKYRDLRTAFNKGEIPPMCKGCGNLYRIKPHTLIPYDINNFLYPNCLDVDYTYNLRWSGRTAQFLNKN